MRDAVRELIEAAKRAADDLDSFTRTVTSRESGFAIILRRKIFAAEKALAASGAQGHVAQAEAAVVEAAGRMANVSPHGGSEFERAHADVLDSYAALQKARGEA